MSDPKRTPGAFRLDHPGLEHDPVAPVPDVARPGSLEGGAPRPPRRARLGRLFLVAAGALVSLAAGLWVSELVSALFARAQWLGWTGLALAAVAGAALLLFVTREVAGLLRLARVTHLRARAEEAAAQDDRDAARAVVGETVALYAAIPATARARARTKAHAAEIIDGRDLLLLAERDLMTPLDEQARALVFAAARRVSLVTAISPRALVDIAFVLFESLRLIRAVGTLYGGRPAGFALLRLVRLVLGHLAITGGIAMSEGVVQQLVGHGLAARLSARLGEGVVNGLLTARIGLAALDVCRPLPWLANRPPRLADIMSQLAGTSAPPERSP